jgi:hypothetical protein
MYDLVFEKFSQWKNLKEMLLKTGNSHIEEGNYWHDNFWGNCRCGNRDGRRPDCLLQGKNHLGIILMDVRDELEVK